MAKLDRYVHNSMWEYMRTENLKIGDDEDQLDPEPTREVCARYRNIIMSDREKYNGASTDEVADHFTDWVDDRNNDQRGNVNGSVCLLVDEEALYWLRDAPPPTTEMTNQNVCIKVIDADFDPDDMSECDPRYKGWALARLNQLWYLYGLVHTGDCPLSGQVLNEISTYDGGVWWWIG
jgi:hypothetical protein